MTAWVEMFFSDRLDLYNCAKCPANTRKARDCDSDNWEHTKGRTFPLKLLEHGADHAFCPSKLHRDDPLFAAEMQTLWLSWKLGKSPQGGSIGAMTLDEIDLLSSMIYRWEELSRSKDFDKLARMLVGEPKKTKGK